MKYSPAVVSATTGPEPAQSGLIDVLPRLFRALKTQLPLEVPGLGRVTPDQLGVLAHLVDSAGCTMGELASARGIALNSATALVDRLLAAGYISREHAAFDRRVVRVSATRTGARLVGDLRRRRDQALRRLVAQLDQAELASIEAALPGLEHLCQLALQRRRPE